MRGRPLRKENDGAGWTGGRGTGRVSPSRGAGVQEGFQEPGGPGARAEGQADKGRHSGQREEPLQRKARGRSNRLEGILTQEVDHGEQ